MNEKGLKINKSLAHITSVPPPKKEWMDESLPKSSSGDEDHPEVSQTECSSIDYHPHQRHEVDRQGGLPGGGQKNKALNTKPLASWLLNATAS